MKKVLFRLTAIAIGALAVPMVGTAAERGGVSSGGGVSAGGGVSGRAGGTAAPMTAPGGNFSASGQFSGKSSAGSNSLRNGNFVSNQGRTQIQSNIRNDRIASSGNWGRHDRHHRHHRFVPFAAFGDFGYDDYATYDSCWDYAWTPAGYQRIYICGGPGYAYYNY